MLRIDSNQTIRISRGDEVTFPLFVNKGSRIEPIRYTFKNDDIWAESSNVLLQPSVVFATFASQIHIDGIYTFTYTSNGWVFKNNVVSLDTYGISILGIPSVNDTITVHFQQNDGCEVYFYITQVNQKPEGAIKALTFTSNNNLYRDSKGETNGDMGITFTSATTSDIPEGEYRYIIKAKIIDTEVIDESTGTVTRTYKINTITNRNKFYVVDDYYSIDYR